LHCHDRWEIIYQRTGHVQTRQDADVISMSPGTVLVHPPGVVHADFASGRYTLYFLQFDTAASPLWPRMCHDDPDLNIGRVCESICREFRADAAGRDTLLGLLTGELDILLRRTYQEQEQSSGRRIVAEAERLLEERYADTIRMSALAREIGVSRSSLYAHFATMCGQTPPDYLLSVRLRHALGLLHHSSLTLDAIAARCGFYSASHLSRHVKDATGVSPGRLRRRADAPSGGASVFSASLTSSNTAIDIDVAPRSTVVDSIE
jgi:AraC-like DNA-binding protein